MTASVLATLTTNPKVEDISWIWRTRTMTMLVKRWT